MCPLPEHPGRVPPQSVNQADLCEAGPDPVHEAAPVVAGGHDGATTAELSGK